MNSNKRRNRNISFLAYLAFGGFSAIALFLASCAINPAPQVEETEISNSLPVEITEIKEEPTQITQAQEATVDPFADWQSYTNENFRIKIKYPSTWFGPDVYEVDNEIRLAIGSDKVYPYGTDRTEQIYQVINSYYITIRYQENQATPPWMNTARLNCG